jgi:hypothetical protein
MSAPDYFHFRAFWGAFDVTYTTPEYTGSALVSAGTSAAPGSGVGVRRAQLRFARTPPSTFDDDLAEMHFDFMNITGGDPDDTWTDTDFSDLEGYLSTWFTAVAGRMHTSHTFQEIRWYRIGTGVTPPNPAERVTAMGAGGTASSSMLPPQNAASITLKTARRKQWGRTYFPGLTSSSHTSAGQLGTGTVDDLAAATDALAVSAKTKQFYLGVVSDVAGSFFAAEQVQVDDVSDIIRSRRWRNKTYVKVLPT